MVSLTVGFLVFSFAEGLRAGVLAASMVLFSLLYPWSAGTDACDGAAEY